MRNWAGNLEFNPLNEVSPSTEEDIRSIILSAIESKQTIRSRGSAHSWTGLIETNSIFMNLDHYQGIVKTDKAKQLVTVKSGTKLHQFSEDLFSHGLSLENQGDINQQSMAGATSTGTHGTGITLQSISNQLTAVKLINGLGETITFDESHPEFNAARLSLGSLGIITQLTFKAIDAYKLKVETFAESFEQSLEAFEERLKGHRHLEMFYFPVGGWSMTKLMDFSQESPSKRTLLTTLNEKVLENWLYTQLNSIASSSGRYKLIDKIMRQFVSKKITTDWSHRAFPTERSFKFMEMEYNLPLEKFHEVMDEVRSAIKKNQFQTLFPIEIRFVKADDIWLSPAYERDSVYFAVHSYIKENHRPYFTCVEEIFKKHGGRPHWGKLHQLKRHNLELLYPRFKDFLKVRERHDPNGIFLNSHLKDIFGV
jgi:FAD-linked oxidoreductase